MEAIKKTYNFAGFSKEGYCKMDVYTPIRPRADRACVIALHGGGFAEGARDDEWSVRTADALTGKGFVVVCPDYRLGMQDEWIVKENSSLLRLGKLFQYCVDLALEDLGKVISYLWLKSEELQINMNRVVLMGCSAGAIVALQYEYLRATVERYGEIKYRQIVAGAFKPAAIVAYAGAVLANHFEYNYPPSVAPTLLFHGLKDRIVRPGKIPCSLNKSFFGSKRVFKKMSRLPNPICWMFLVKNIGHEVSMILPETVDIFCSFFEHALDSELSLIRATICDVHITPTEWTTKTIWDLMDENSQKLGLSK